MKYRHLSGYKYELLAPIVVDVKGLPNVMTNGYLGIQDGQLFISQCYAWNGPSGPTIDTLTFIRGSLIHDALYQLIREGKLGMKYRKFADRKLYNVCILDGMNKFRAWYVYHAVRITGGHTLRTYKDTRGKIVILPRG